MKEIGFFEGLFHDIGYREREALNDAAHALQMQGISQEAQSRAMENLFALHRAQSVELRELRGVVEVLSGMLLDAGLLDHQVFADRLEDKLRTVAEPEVSQKESNPRQGHPYRGAVGAQGAKSADAPLATLNCGECGEQVYAQDTQITEFGVVCDSCYHKSQETPPTEL